MKLKKILALFVSAVLIVPLIGNGIRTFAYETVNIYPNVKSQALEGWGTSLCWFANVVGGAPDAVRNDYADLLFDADRGLGMNVVRYNIGGGENPQHLPPNTTFLQNRAIMQGFEPSEGVWDWTADANQRWMLSAAIARGANQLEAFSNSPPYWMTNSGSVTGTGQLVAGNNLNSSYQNAFADYLTTVVRHFRDNWGITFKTLEPFNEPVSFWWTYKHSQEGCHYDNSYMNTLIPLIGASLQNKGLSTGISAMDNYSINDTISSANSFDSTAQSCITQYNTHGYTGSNLLGLFNLAKVQGKDLWMSEYGDNDTSGLTMAGTIINQMKIMKATAWVVWQAVENNGSGWGLMESNLNNPTDYSYTICKKYYVMANFSKFMRPGARFIEIGNGSGLATLDNSGRLVIVMLNKSDTDESYAYDLSGFSATGSAVSVYRTSATENLVKQSDINVTGGSFTATAKAKSVTTYVLSSCTENMPSPAFDGSTSYKIINRNSQKTLDVKGQSLSDGAQVQQWSYWGGDNQKWRFVYMGNGCYQIKNVNSGLLMDISGASLEDGANNIQYHDDYGANQQWRIEDDGGGYYTIRSLISSKVLDIKNCSTSDGASCIQYADNGGTNQQWQIVPD